MTIIRRLKLGEEHLYRAVRLESLRESPEAFSSRYADAVSRSDESWAAQANSTATGSDRATFVALSAEPVGLAALYRNEQSPDTGELIQMWVAPEMRDGSVATELLAEIFRWAGSHRFSRVKAEVLNSNTRALKFYAKFGFKVSTEKADHPSSSVILLKPIKEVVGLGRLLPSSENSSSNIQTPGD